MSKEQPKPRYIIEFFNIHEVCNSSELFEHVFLQRKHLTYNKLSKKYQFISKLS